MRMIDGDKLLKWMSTQYIGFTEKFEEQLKAKISVGDFDLDPIPLPTIKPRNRVNAGDKVKHKEIDYGIGCVINFSSNLSSALVRFPKQYTPMYYKLDNLEVMEVIPNE